MMKTFISHLTWEMWFFQVLWMAGDSGILFFRNNIYYVCLTV